MAVLKRIKCLVSYDGSNFNGFQIQKEGRSIQGEIQLALFKIHKERVPITGSGRTDKGVHAIAQVFHFDTPLNLNGDEWMRALNSLLPADIYIKEAEVIDSSFHARFDVKEKTYVYRLNLGDYNPLERNYVYQYNRYLDIDRMIEASKLFIGSNDYRNFCSNSETEVDDYIREVYEIEIDYKNDEVTFTFKGNGFMRYMVRMMVGTLIAIGAHKETKKYIEERINNKEHLVTTYNAPSEGLYLKEVKY